MRGTARERLLAAALELADSDGYLELTVEGLLASAGVSRATFYQYFCSAEDCFVAMYRQWAEWLAQRIAAATVRSDRPERVALDVLAELASERPQLVRVLMTECLAAGPAGYRERDTLIGRLADATERSASRDCTIDLPLPLLFGGVFRFLSMRLGRDDAGDDLQRELRDWLSVWACSSSQPRWCARLTPPQSPRPSARSARHPVQPRGPVRERIVRGTAHATRAKGFAAVTVTDIAAVAGVSRRTFYKEFRDKTAAVVAAYEYVSEQTVAACAPAFFGAGDWPERVWTSGLAFTSYLAGEPLFAHLGFVNCYSTGRSFQARVHDSQLAFTLFLEEGQRLRPATDALARERSALTAATIFEGGFQACRTAPEWLRALQPLAVYIALAPFIGVEEAGAFVAGKLGAGRRVRDQAQIAVRARRTGPPTVVSSKPIMHTPSARRGPN